MAGRLPVVLLLIAGLALAIRADDPKWPDVVAFDKLVVDTLRDVHNKGADLYNTKKEFDAAYRLYQGALLTVRPFLAHRPAAQKLIDDGLAAAEQEPTLAQKAFRLHEVIEAVRAHLKTKLVPAKVTTPLEVAPRPKEKPSAPPPGAGPALSGRVIYQGKNLAAAEVMLVTLNLPRPRVFTTTTQADGSYALPGPMPAGPYVVVLNAKGLPEKFRSASTSGIRLQVQPDRTQQDIVLPDDTGSGTPKKELVAG
jgi:hypothetical protein